MGLTPTGSEPTESVTTALRVGRSETSAQLVSVALPVAPDAPRHAQATLRISQSSTTDQLTKREEEEKQKIDDAPRGGGIGYCDEAQVLLLCSGPARSPLLPPIAAHNYALS